ncbi:MAG TPA: hypothetical protein VD994_09535 [Prosthecobacter sp.]|nr:hypothetical protein [Prosthecobacter sp.]
MKILSAMAAGVALVIVLCASGAEPLKQEPAEPERRLVISGFEPFGGRKVNTSLLVAQAVVRTVVEMRQAALPVEVPVIWGVPRRVVEGEGERGWRLWVAFGEGGPGAFRIEARAFNRRKPIPDNQQRIATETEIRKGGEAVLTNPFPVRALAELLREQGVAVEVSGDAGGYLCEELYYELLTARAGRENCVVLFIHVPRLGSALGKGGAGAGSGLMDEAAIVDFAGKLLPAIEKIRAGGER